MDIEAVTPDGEGTGEFALDSADTTKVLELLKKSNSVEMKVTLSYSDRMTLRRLGFDPVDAVPWQSYYFETPNLDLHAAGLTVCARRGPNGRGQTSVKLRPVDPASLDRKFIHDTNIKIEIDVMHGAYVCSASTRGRCTSDEVYDASEGRIPLESIFSQTQQDFYRRHASFNSYIGDLLPMGPVFLLALSKQPADFDRKMTIELWLYPDGSRVLELSTRGYPEEAFQLGARFRAFLGMARLMKECEAKTRTGEVLRAFT